MTVVQSPSWVQYIEANQLTIATNILIGLYSCEFVGARYSPKLYEFADRFLHLQNMIEIQDGKPIYDISGYDAYYVVHWVILLSFLRLFFMKWCFEPCAKHLCNIHSRKAKVRFSEQSWSIVYYCCSFAVGFYLYFTSPYWNNVANVYVGWPHYRMSALLKKYYLVSIAFWLQQVMVLNIEERRKDHYQMFSHHIITCALVIGSYYYYFNRIGNLILMIMDSVDIFLSSAKVLKYLGFATLCDYMFMLFLVSWIVLRHGVYNWLYYQTWIHTNTLLNQTRCAQDENQKRCLTPAILDWFLGLLGGLQVITCIWMYLILKVAVKVVTGRGAEDVRSDEDDTDVEAMPEVASDGSANTEETLTDEVDEKTE